MEMTEKQSAVGTRGKGLSKGGATAGGRQGLSLVGESQGHRRVSICCVRHTVCGTFNGKGRMQMASKGSCLNHHPTLAEMSYQYSAGKDDKPEFELSQ